MTKEQAKEFYPIMQAFAEGGTIECRTKPSALKDENVPNEWAEIKVIEFNDNKEYRIKPNLEPESEYRPFKDAEECWAEMQKHQPFGWVNGCDGSKFTIETIASSDSSIIVSDEGAFYFGEMFKKFKFADGVPFGVKVEE